MLVHKTAHRQGQPVSASPLGHQLSVVCQTPPWRGEVCVLAPGVPVRVCCVTTEPTSGEEHSFCRLILWGHTHTHANTPSPAPASCARTSCPWSHQWGDLTDASSVAGGDACPTCQVGRSRSRTGLLLRGPPGVHALSMVRGPGGRRGPSSREPLPPSWSSPHHTDHMCRTEWALLALTSQSQALRDPCGAQSVAA